MSGPPKGYADLGDLPEDERIGLVARVVRDGGAVAGIFVDAVNAERYTKKLEARGCKVVERVSGPLPGVVTLKVAPLPPD